MGLTTINLSDEAKRLAQSLIDDKSFSKWVDNKILTELKDEKSLRAEIEELKEETKKKQEQLARIEEFNKKTVFETAKQKKEISNLEMLWWKKCIHILENRGKEYADGQRMSYNNEFNQNINKFDFLTKYDEMLKELGPQNEESL